MIGSLIVVLTALLVSVSAQNPPIINPSSGRPPVITGISGCTAQSTTRTVNCHRPATLTLTGSGFMTGLEYEPNVSWQLMVSLYASPDDQNPLWCTFNSGVDTSLVCEVPSYGFGKIPPNQLYAVQLMNWSTRNTSTLNDAVSFAPETSPRVDRVRGCSQISPDGRSASQCDVARDQITLVGSGFRNVDGQLATLSLGSASNLVQLIVDNQFLIRIDEDEIVFNFGGSNSFLPAIGAQSGQPLSLKLADWDVNGLWETEPVYLSFLPLPNPVVTSISAPAWAQGCVTDNSTTPTRFSNCVSGLSLLAVEGSYLFQPITISVNGIQCRVQSIGQTAVYFYMPIFDSVEGVYYDVTVATLAGSVTIPSIIEFNHDPLIYDVVPCIDMGITSAYSLVTAHCMAGQTLTLKVLHVASSTPRVFFRPSLANNSSAVMECPGVSRVDSRTITCTTPPMGDSATWGTFTAVYMWMEWQDGTKSAPISVAPLWDPSNAPRMTALSGCDSSSGNPLHLDKCLGSTSATLTIHGVRFSQPLTNGMAWTVVINNAVICDRPTVVNDETLTCILPNLALQEGTFGGLLYNEKYNIFVQGIAEYTLRTNAGYITFTIDQPSSSSSSSASASTIALATVFSIVGALLIGACLFYLLRSARVNKQRAALQSPEFSSTGQHVELEEV